MGHCPGEVGKEVPIIVGNMFLYNAVSGHINVCPRTLPRFNVVLRYGDGAPWQAHCRVEPLFMSEQSLHELK